MASRFISERTRKIVWARAGGMCSYSGCLKNLILAPTSPGDSPVVVGELAYIVGQSENGPRGKEPFRGNDRNNPENLLLLCADHHKLIDQQINAYPAARLYLMKDNHEQWVREHLLSGYNLQLPLSSTPGKAENFDRNALLESIPSLGKAHIEILYCYARKDEKLRDELALHLEPLKRAERITTWYDRQIEPGMDWNNEINVHLSTAHIILLLISPHFLASNYCYSVEMEQALKRHQSGEVRVIPIILEPADWQHTPVGKLQASPQDGKPITMWRNRQEALLDVVQGIRHVIHTLSQ